MSGIFGILGLQDNDTSYVSTIGQRLIFDAVNQYLTMVNEDMNTAMSVFVEGTTTNYKERYKLPGGGRLQQMGGQAKPGAVKGYGSWDVAYPLKDFGAMLAEDPVTMAYMTLPELQRHLDTVRIQAINTLRFEMLYALFNSRAGSYTSFVDPIWGTLQVQALANGDATVYPPVLGSESEATENLYLESGYAASGISDTNDPYVTIIDKLEGHFGSQTGGSNIVVFINNAQRALTEALTAFDGEIDNFVTPGMATDVPQRLAGVPGRILGRHLHGAWVVEWRWIPSGWALGVHLDAPAPLRRRIDMPGTNLPSELTLVNNSDLYPISEAIYRWRFGLAVGNRLNGVAFEFGTGGTYTEPTIYA